MNKKRLDNSTFPALYQAADKASLEAQSKYYIALRSYLFLLVVAAFVNFYWPNDQYGALASAALFLVTLGILIWLKIQKPEDIQYNGRAVAESVKTRAWRWAMKAEPYENNVPDEQIQKEFLSDLRAILAQNRSLSSFLEWNPNLGEAISAEMKAVRKLSLPERLAVYKQERIDDQSIWYSKKAQFNKRKAKQWFVASIVLHSAAVLMLLYRIKEPAISLPIGVMATAASAVLTWLQAKKHNELKSSYSLAAHEIVLIKGESASISSDKQLSDFVVNSEAAFSREHTQWTARKNI
jgi:hypothetical protein